MQWIHQPARDRKKTRKIVSFSLWFVVMNNSFWFASLCYSVPFTFNCLKSVIIHVLHLTFFIYISIFIITININISINIVFGIFLYLDNLFSESFILLISYNNSDDDYHSCFVIGIAIIFFFHSSSYV